jgi:hypothetical protein
MAQANLRIVRTVLRERDVASTGQSPRNFFRFFFLYGSPTLKSDVCLQDGGASSEALR